LVHRFVSRFGWRLTPSPALSLLLLLALCTTAFLPVAHAQTTGSLSGTVLDSSGAIIPGAEVTLLDTKSKAKRVTVSNGEGFFTINAVQPGNYNLVITEKGFESFTITGIEMDPGDARTISKIAMKVGSLNQEVTVTATTAGVDLSSGEKSSLITAEDIQRISTVGRDVTELIKFLPGFAVNTGGNLANGQTSANEQTMGFGSSSVSNFSANGATGQTGATTVISDGASVMDPGDMGASITNVNMDMVQEVKVQTSNFGADSAKGPVVINAVGKSGGVNYHGSAYLIARNGALNSNDWLNNNSGVPRPPSDYYFPGANIGGPIKIPGTNLNHSKKMTFFAGFEVYEQTAFQQTLLSFIPTPRMLTGDLTPASIGQALNVDQSIVTAACPNFYTTSGTATVSTPGGAQAGSTYNLGNSGGYCYSPGLTSGSTTYTQQDQLIKAGVVQGGNGLLPVDPRALIYAKFWPAPNRQPQAGNGLASDGYNYAKALTATHNGYQFHGRVDENFTDNTKLYVTYNLEKINDEQPLDNTYYAGSDQIPYPTPLYSNAKANSLSANFTHVFSPTLTNELVPAGTYFYEPNQFANPALVSDASTGWKGGRYYNNGSLQLPGLVDYEDGVPDFAMGYIPPGSAFLRKYSYDVADNVTKQLGKHALKFGVYYEKTSNDQVPYAYSQGLNSFNHYQSGCTTNDGLNTSALQNNVANFLQGCTGFSQASNSDPVALYFRTLDFYASDEWKATAKLTLTLAIRFDHLGPWTDPHGVGLAVWNPPAQHVLDPDVTQDPRTFPGISWHQTNPSVPLSGAPSTFVFFEPRAGLAYDLYGNGKTVFRGGWGAYRFHDSYNDSAGPLATSDGTQSFSVPSNLSCTYDQIENTATDHAAGTPYVAGRDCFSGAAGNTVLSPFSIYALDPHDNEQPVTYNYNFTVDQELAAQMHLQISYTGNQSHHIFTEGNLSNQNYIPLGGLFQPDPLTGAVTVAGSTQQDQQDYRPYPNYTSVFVPNHIAYGNYNGLQVSLTRQKGAFIFNVNYTWSKALGVRGDYRTGAVGDPSNLRNNYGYLGFNRPQIVNFVYSYQVGNAYHGKKFVAALVNQWEISGVTGIQSGADTAVLNGSTNYGLGGGVSYTPPGATSSTAVSLNNTTVLGTPDIELQPVLTCDPKHGLHPGPAGLQYINGSCFALPQLGTNGQFELPNINGPAYISSDLSVQRSFSLTTQKQLQFRIAASNFLNHPLPQFYGPGGSVPNLTLTYGSPAVNSATSAAEAIAQATQTSTNFGYTPYKGGYRIVTFTARFNF